MPPRAAPRPSGPDLAAALAHHARTLRDLTRELLASSRDPDTLAPRASPARKPRHEQPAPGLADLADQHDPDTFADTLAQTLACSLLTARLTLPADAPRLTPHTARAALPADPELDALFAAALESPALRPTLDAIADLLARTDLTLLPPSHDLFEPFLAAYDPALRSRRGVFYTPTPVVAHLVRAVDTHLRDEFGLTDGLASTDTWSDVAARLRCPVPAHAHPDHPFIHILDPATGTATFLIVTLERIHHTLLNRWSRELARPPDDPTILARWRAHVPTLLPRLVGHEVMPAPCTLARLRLLLKLRETGYHAHPAELQVHRTNSLAPPERPYTVILGNPPWSGHSFNNDRAWIVDRVHDYRRGIPQLAKPGQAKWLQDDYVKFIRLAEWTIARAGAGVVGFVTSHGFLDNPTFRGLRRSLLDTFNNIRLLDLHGNTKARERTDLRDENVFEIQQGVAVSLLSRNPGRTTPVRLRGDLWGDRLSKFRHLAADDVTSEPFTPAPDLHLFTREDPALRAEYERGVPLHRAMAPGGDPAPGIVTTHDEFAVAFTEAEMRAKVERLLATTSEAEARAAFRLCTQSQWRYQSAMRALASGAWRSALTKILYRPFDVRWTVYDPHVAVHRRDRVMRHLLAGDNLALVTTRSVEIGRGFEHVFVTRHLAQHHAVSIKEVNFVFPLHLHGDGPPRPNYSDEFLSRLTAAIAPPTPPAESLFNYIYTILHSPTYRARYAPFLRTDFPRIPLPTSRQLFNHLSILGARLVALHLLNSSELDAPLTTYLGPDDPQVEKITREESTVFLDRARTARFAPVPADAWNYNIGGSTICARWLRDRRGRILTAADRRHFVQVVAALSKTSEIVPRIDAEIAAHGGWPDAFTA